MGCRVERRDPFGPGEPGSNRLEWKGSIELEESGSLDETGRRAPPIHSILCPTGRPGWSGAVLSDPRTERRGGPGLHWRGGLPARRHLAGLERQGKGRLHVALSFRLAVRDTKISMDALTGGYSERLDRAPLTVRKKRGGSDPCTFVEEPVEGRNERARGGKRSGRRAGGGPRAVEVMITWWRHEEGGRGRSCGAAGRGGGGGARGAPLRAGEREGRAGARRRGLRGIERGARCPGTRTNGGGLRLGPMRRAGVGGRPRLGPGRGYAGVRSIVLRQRLGMTQAEFAEPFRRRSASTCRRCCSHAPTR